MKTWYVAFTHGSSFSVECDGAPNRTCGAELWWEFSAGGRVIMLVPAVAVKYMAELTIKDAAPCQSK